MFVSGNRESPTVDGNPATYFAGAGHFRTLGDLFRVHTAAILDAANRLEASRSDLDPLTYSALPSFSTAYTILRDELLDQS